MKLTEVLAECEQVQERYGCFTRILHEHAEKAYHDAQERAARGEELPLLGTFLTVKDNLCIAGEETTAGSQILKGYRPTFTATVLQRLEAAGAVIVAMTSMDEFGFGTWNQNTELGAPKNPRDPTRVSGGSSGGAAVAAAVCTFPHIAVAESTGGSIETPAALCGTIGFCPGYGRTSRHGLISYADSLDKIGFLAQDPCLIETALETCSGPDGCDMTVTEKPLQEARKATRIALVGMKHATPGVAAQVRAFTDKLSRNGYSVEEQATPVTDTFGVAAYYVIAMSEASTNLMKYAGLRYGKQGDPRGKTYPEYATPIRTEGLGQEAKRRMLLGTYTRMEGHRDRYYAQARAARAQIRAEYAALLEDYDIIISPTFPRTAPTQEEAGRQSPAETYAQDILTVGPNLTGLPHASIPAGENEGLPVGVLATMRSGEERSLLAFIKEVQG